MKLFSTKIAELFTKSEGFSKKQDFRSLFKLILWDVGVQFAHQADSTLAKGLNGERRVVDEKFF